MTNDERTVHEGFMRRALELAQGGRFGAHPNPLVGAVVVREGALVGEGFHARYGGPHAEIGALRQAGERARGADLYVTLEPCRHYGKTPPCTKAVIEAGVARVFVGTEDPHRELSGGGAAILREAGIEAIEGVLEEECKFLIRAFTKRIRTGMPWVTQKSAISLDGKVASRTGHSRWISCGDSRRRVHEKRAEVDAIITGRGTVRIDDPMLSVRLEGRAQVQPRRIVLDPDGRTAPRSRIAQSAFDQPVTLVVSDRLPEDKVKTWEALGVHVLRLPCPGRIFAWKDLLSWCGSQPMNEVLIEAGPGLTGSAFDAHAVDSVMVFIAPKIVGGVEAPGAVGGLGVETLDRAVRLVRVNLQPVGPDFLYTADVEYPE